MDNIIYKQSRDFCPQRCWVQQHEPMIDASFGALLSRRREPERKIGALGFIQLFQAQKVIGSPGSFRAQMS